MEDDTMTSSSTLNLISLGPDEPLSPIALSPDNPLPTRSPSMSPIQMAEDAMGMDLIPVYKDGLLDQGIIHYNGELSQSCVLFTQS